jgi:hypothetical protein
MGGKDMRHIFRALLALLALYAGAASAQIDTIFQPGGDLTGTWNSQTVGVGAITDAKGALANKPPVNLACDATCGNLTLSGAQTIDGVLGTAGVTTVLLTAQSTASQNGPWVMQTGAWTRPSWYPSGGTTQAFQYAMQPVLSGTLYSGSRWAITTTGAITIDTTSTAWAIQPLALNSSTVASSSLPLPSLAQITGGDFLGNSGSSPAAPAAVSPQTATSMLGLTAINLRTVGALGNAISWADGTITTGTNTFTSASASFTAADVGKTIQVDGAGSGGITGAPLVTTIAGYTNSTTVTLNTNASTTTPLNYLKRCQVATPQGTGNVVPGDTFALTGGTSTTTGVCKTWTTAVQSASVYAGGSGGTNGTQTVTGTTGTGFKFTASVTVSGGGITAVLSITNGGHYIVNPTSLTNEPVTGANLVGAALTVVTGADEMYPSTVGNYSVVPGNPISTGAGGTSGATGVTVTATWQATGTYTYATDDSTALAACITDVITLATAQSPAYCYAPSGNYYIGATTTIPVFYRTNGGIYGDGRGKTWFIVGANFTGASGPSSATASGTLFAFSDIFDKTTAGTGTTISGRAYNGPTATINKGFGFRFGGLSVTGDRLATTTQNALVLYDRIINATVDDFDVYFLNGRCFGSGTELNTTATQLTESRLGNIRCENTGASATPTFEINAIGSGGGFNEIESDSINIYASHGTGVLIHSNSGSNGNGLRFKSIRIEGTEDNSNAVAADSMDIGLSTDTGSLNGMTIKEYWCVNPYTNYYCLRLDAGSSALQTYSFSLDDSMFGGGAPMGGGLNVQAGRQLIINSRGSAVWGTAFLIGASPKAGSGITINPGCAPATNVTWSIDSSETANVFVPTCFNGGSGAVAPTSLSGAGLESVLAQSGLAMALPPSTYMDATGNIVIGSTPASSATVSFSATSGSVTATFSAGAPLSGTSAGDVGRIITVKDTTYKICTVTAFSSTTAATCTLSATLSGTGPFANSATWISGTNSTTNTASSAGATYSVPLSSAYANAYLSFPASGPITSSGQYYCQMATTVTGVCYSNTYTTGTPTIPTTPTAFSGLTAGQITQNTATVTPMVSASIAAGVLLNNGCLFWDVSYTNNNSAGGKSVNTRMGSSGVGISMTTQTYGKLITKMCNAGNASTQVVEGINQNPTSTALQSQAATRTAVNTANAQTITVNEQLVAAATDTAAVEGYAVTMRPQ